MPKPTVSPDQIEAMLRQSRENASDFCPIAEGLASQAFRFRSGDAEYVIRVNQALTGVKKDLLVSQKFARAALPIPEVVELGHLEDGHAYCISRLAPGVRLQDLDADGIMRVTGSLLQAMEAITFSDLAGTTGFGRFDAAGTAAHASWRDYLCAINDPRQFDWRQADHSIDRSVVDQAKQLVTALAASCPEDRCLIHGDFSAYNVLADSHQVTAVIDWDLALFGDPLYEVANLFFWSEKCLEPLRDQCTSRWSCLPQWQERLLCYQLRIGLQEIYESAVEAGPMEIAWLTARCAEIIRHRAG